MLPNATTVLSDPARRAAAAPRQARTAHYNRRVKCRLASHSHDSGIHELALQGDCAKMGRRAVLGASSILLLSQAISAPANAADDQLSTYLDETDKFSVSIPSTWLSGQGALSGNTGFSGSSGGALIVGVMHSMWWCHVQQSPTFAALQAAQYRPAALGVCVLACVSLLVPSCRT